MKKSTTCKLIRFFAFALIFFSNFGLTQTRYSYSVDGSEVFDAKTGLTWKRCSEGQTWQDKTCINSATTFNHSAALHLISQQKNWRLPNIKELSSIAERATSQPAIDGTAFPKTESNTYWSSTPETRSGSISAWTLDFNFGVSVPVVRTFSSHIRLVKIDLDKQSFQFNDTGITQSQCFSLKTANLVNCQSVEAKELSNTQDGMVGRDSQFTDDSDGRLGFSFGLVPKAGTGFYDKTECVKDKISGLIWEGKPSDSSNRDFRNMLTNFDQSNKPQRPNNQFPTDADINSITNTIGYIGAINSARLCGFSDWRLPTVEELHSIFDFGQAATSMDSEWLINTPTQRFYWSSTANIKNQFVAWNIILGLGRVSGTSRQTTGFVRLVR